MVYMRGVASILNVLDVYLWQYIYIVIAFLWTKNIENKDIYVNENHIGYEHKNNATSKITYIFY